MCSLDKAPTKGPKSRWFCQACLKLPGQLHLTQTQLQKALEKIIYLQEKLAALSVPRPSADQCTQYEEQISVDYTDVSDYHNIDTPEMPQRYADVCSPTPLPPKVLIIGDSVI